ncbi:MAG TPA: class I SAM-dependent methyltransferase [Gemmataceae bacterium]|nr:class I SAM-dependent methyltransferase [Gemmataceae bacterium]
MPTHTTDKDWEHFGKLDPYWAVYTDERFRKSSLTEAALQEFFASGEAYVDFVFRTIRRHLDEEFSPAAVLDFGCGVGRLLVPFAKRCCSVVGIDVSDGMLQEAKSQCASIRLTNVRLVKSDDYLSNVTEKFDLINSYIVLQHVSTERGEVIARSLIERLNDGGIGVLHFTYDKQHSNDPSGKPSVATESRLPSALRFGRSFAASVARLLRAHGRRPPEMQMNSYDLNSIFAGLQNAGVRRIHVEFTNHDGCYGVLIFFKKESHDQYLA